VSRAMRAVSSRSRTNETRRGRPSSTLWAHPADWHPNALAHRLVADALAPRVRAAATR
jgi:hypothetical protein